MSTEPNVSPERSDASTHPSGNGRITHPPLIVVGMHRSGTSFVASLLHAAGLDMGSRLMPAAHSNERGHFENMDFVEFHMRELRLSGHDDAGWTTQQSLTLSKEAIAEAHDIIESSARSSAWGWKDPRTTLFLDFWSSVVPDANYLYIYREPSEVVDSLYRRGDESIQLSPELAVRAILTHNEIMLRHARKHRARSIIANVSAVARNPEQLLSMLAEKFSIEVNVDTQSPFESELMRTIDPDAPHATLLRHFVPAIDQLYSSLEREADIPSGVSESTRPRERRVKDAFFRGWQVERKRDGDLFALEAELDGRSAAANAALDELRESNAKRGEHLAEAERLLAVERAAHQDLEIRFEQTVTAEREEREALARELTAQTEALIAAARAESEMIASLIATVQSSTFWKIKRGLGRLRRLLYLDRR